MKKLSIILAVILFMVCGTIPVSARRFGGSCGANVFWSYIDGELFIYGNGPMDDGRVDKDWQHDLLYNGRVGIIEIQEGVTRIGDHAFWGFDDVTSVKMADSVTSIGDEAFGYTRALRVMKLGNGVTTLENEVFGNESGLKSILIPKSVKTIGEDCFPIADSDIYDGLATVYYSGGGLDWANISIGEGNYGLEKADKYMNQKLVDGIQLSEKYLSMYVGMASFRLTVQDLEGNVIDSPLLTWKCSQPEIASVSDGTVIAHTVGSAYVTAEYQGYSVGCPVSVNSASGLSLSVSEETISIDETMRIRSLLHASEVPALWHSSDSSVATVSSNGVVTGVSVGTVTITATYYDGTATATITVVPRREGDCYYEGTTIIGTPYTDAEYLTIPATVGGKAVTAIAPYAFEGMSNLRVVSIPETVKVIGTGAFWRTPLEEVNFSGTSYQWVNVAVDAYNTPVNEAKKIYSNSIWLGDIFCDDQDWNTVTLRMYHQELTAPVTVYVHLQVVDEDWNAIAAYAETVVLSTYSNETSFQVECYPTDGNLLMKACVYDDNGTILGETENINWLERQPMWVQDAVICATGKNTAEFWSGGYFDWEKGIYAIPDYVSDERGSFTIERLGSSYSFGSSMALVIPDTIKEIGKEVLDTDSNVTAIGYMGTKEQWDAIRIMEPNDWLNSLPITYNYKGANVMNAEFYVNPHHMDEVIGAVFKVEKAYKDCTAVVEIWNQQKTVLEKVKYIPIEAGIDKEYQIIEAFAGDDEQHRMVVRFELDGVECSPSRLNYNFYAERPIYEKDGFLYKVYDDYAGIVGYMGEALDIVIPETLDGYSVKSLGTGAFCGMPIESVKIPATVTEMGFDVFTFCESLKEITISQDNPSYCVVDGVIFTKDKKTLYYYPCGSDKISYIVPYGTERIFGAAFACSKLEEIILPDTLTYIGEVAFYETKIKNITIPKSVQMIDGMALSECYLLEEIKVSEENEIYCDMDGVLFSKDKTALLQYPAGKKQHTYRIPDGVTHLGYSSMGMANFQTVYVPKTVRTADTYVFSNQLDYILCEGSEAECSQWLSDWQIGAMEAEKRYSVEFKDAQLDFVESRYCNGTLSVSAEFLYLTKEGTAVVGVYDTQGKLADVQMIPVGLDKGTITCDFAANNACLDYTVKVMYLDGTSNLMPYSESVDSNVKKSVVIENPYETDHPYRTDTPYEFFYQYDGECESIDITFSEETAVINWMDFIYVYGNGYGSDYTGDDLSGVTVRVPGNYVNVSLYPASNAVDTTDYGFKIEKLTVNLP